MRGAAAAGLVEQLEPVVSSQHGAVADDPLVKVVEEIQIPKTKRNQSYQMQIVM